MCASNEALPEDAPRQKHASLSSLAQLHSPTRLAPPGPGLDPARPGPTRPDPTGTGSGLDPTGSDPSRLDALTYLSTIRHKKKTRETRKHPHEEEKDDLSKLEPYQREKTKKNGGGVRQINPHKFTLGKHAI